MIDSPVSTVGECNSSCKSKFTKTVDISRQDQVLGSTLNYEEREGKQIEAYEILEYRCRDLPYDYVKRRLLSV